MKFADEYRTVDTLRQGDAADAIGVFVEAHYVAILRRGANGRLVARVKARAEIQPVRHGAFEFPRCHAVVMISQILVEPGKIPLRTRGRDLVGAG